MQLIRINHERCLEHAVTTFVLAPDEWSNEVIKSRIRDAQKAYQEAIDLAKKLAEEDKPDYSVWSYAPSIDKLAELYPTHTMLQLKEIRDAEKAKYNAWQEKKRLTTDNFSEYLKKEGFCSIYLGEENGGPLSIDLDWGHQHGTQINYGSNLKVDDFGLVEPTDTLPTPEELAGVKEDDNDFS